MITVQPYDILDWKDKTDNVEFRIWLDEPIDVDSIGLLSLPSVYRKVIPTFSSFTEGTYTGTKCTLPAIPLHTTTNSSKPNIKYRCGFYRNGVSIESEFIVSEFKVDSSLGATTSWTILKIASDNRVPTPIGFEAFSKEQAFTLFGSSNLIMPKSSIGIIGGTELDKQPDDVNHPKAVGVNSDLIKYANLFFNVQKFGAKGDGVTDDTSAIIGAIAAAELLGGGRLYFPHPSNSYLISGAGSQIFLIQKPLVVEGEDVNTFIKIKSTTPSGTYAFRYKPATANDSEGFQISKFWIIPESGLPGAGLALDCTNAPIANWKISDVVVSQLGGNSLALTNPTHRADGIFLGTVINSQFAGNVVYDYVGDSVNTIFTDFNGAGKLDITLVGGAATPTFIHLNLTNDGGVDIHSGKNILWQHNQHELQVSSNTGIGGAFIRFLGDIGAIQDANIKHNLFQGGGAAPALNAINFGNQSGSTVGDNTYNLPSGKALLDISNISGFFQLSENNHGRGINPVDVSNPFNILWFYKPDVTAVGVPGEQGGSIWITTIKATNLQVVNTAPVANLNASPTTYDIAGTQLPNQHIVKGTVVLDGVGTATVNLTGAAVFTNAASFKALGTNDNTGGVVQMIKNSGSSITFNGGAGHTIEFVLIGS